jgi:glucose-1-phosphate thymidylyltransferase
LESHQFLLKQTIQDPTKSDTKIIQPVWIHPKADIQNSQIGPHVTVDEGAVVINSSIQDSIIGEFSRVINHELNHVLLAKHTRIDGDSLDSQPER